MVPESENGRLNETRSFKMLSAKAHVPSYAIALICVALRDEDETFRYLDKALEAFKKVGAKYDILGKTKQEIIAQYGL